MCVKLESVPLNYKQNGGHGESRDVMHSGQLQVTRSTQVGYSGLIRLSHNNDVKATHWGQTWVDLGEAIRTHQLLPFIREAVLHLKLLLNPISMKE